jgi:hypothetical protein
MRRENWTEAGIRSSEISPPSSFHHFDNSLTMNSWAQANMQTSREAAHTDKLSSRLKSLAASSRVHWPHPSRRSF